MLNHVIPNKFSEIILKFSHREGYQPLILFCPFAFFIRRSEMGQEAEGECDQVEMAFDSFRVPGLVIAQAQQLFAFFKEHFNPPAFCVTLEDGFLREPKVIGDNRKKALFFAPAGEDNDDFSSRFGNLGLDPLSMVSDVLSLAVFKKDLGRLLPEKLFSKLPDFLFPSLKPEIPIGLQGGNKEEAFGHTRPDNLLGQIIRNQRAR